VRTKQLLLLGVGAADKRAELVFGDIGTWDEAAAPTRLTGGRLFA